MEELEAAKFIPVGCEFVYYSMLAIIATLSSVVVYLFIDNKRLNKELLRFASKGTEALETLAKLTK